ncbi:MAG: hypothetical protein RR420_01220 [Anaerovoracaceae bacterium]
MANHPVLEVDLSKVDPNFEKSIRNIENKPHTKYIRYLMSKKYSPISIRRELTKLGLSSPHEPALAAYYLNVLDPVVKELGLGELYSDYKRKLLKKDNVKCDYNRSLLNYRLHVGGKADLEVKFHKFVRYIGCSDVWIGEIYRFHGSASRMPVDEYGERILECTSTCKNTERILTHPKRYLIDKLILENIPDARIVKYIRDNFKASINEYDVAAYKRCFFNIKVNNTEDRIKTLEMELSSLKQLVKDVDTTRDYSEMSVGEKMSLKDSAKKRIKELEANIRTLSALYSEYANKVANSDKADFEAMFAEICVKSFARFNDLDKSRDRDVVDPLIKTAKMMGFAYDKMESIKANKSSTTDKGAGVAMVELYKKRQDEIEKEERERFAKLAGNNMCGDFNLENMDPYDIGGVENLGVNADVDGMITNMKGEDTEDIQYEHQAEPSFSSDDSYEYGTMDDYDDY